MQVRTCAVLLGSEGRGEHSDPPENEEQAQGQQVACIISSHLWTTADGGHTEWLQSFQLGRFSKQPFQVVRHIEKSP